MESTSQHCSRDGAPTNYALLAACLQTHALTWVLYLFSSHAACIAMHNTALARVSPFSWLCSTDSCDAPVPLTCVMPRIALVFTSIPSWPCFVEPTRLLARATLAPRPCSMLCFALQVYKGVLRSNNEPVAVKVQRPGVRDSIALDIFILRRLAGWFREAKKINRCASGPRAFQQPWDPWICSEVQSVVSCSSHAAGCMP